MALFLSGFHYNEHSGLCRILLYIIATGTILCSFKVTVYGSALILCTVYVLLFQCYVTCNYVSHSTWFWFYVLDMCCYCNAL